MATLSAIILSSLLLIIITVSGKDTEAGSPSDIFQYIVDDTILKDDNNNIFQQQEDKRSGLRAALVARGGSPGGPRPRSSGMLIGGYNYNQLPNIQQQQGSIVDRRSHDILPTTAYLSVGVLSDVQQYFNGIKHQLEKMADVADDDIPGLPADLADDDNDDYHRGPHSPSAFHGMGGRPPTASAAYFHALRSHRPSHHVRSFVEDPGPIELRGANNHDPALLWTGLGRRRR